MSSATSPESAPQHRPLEPESDDIALARHVIVDDKGKVFGFELFSRSRPGQGSNACADAQRLFDVLSQADAAGGLGRRNIFVRCAHECLDREHLDLLKPERIVLVIPPIAGHDPATIEATVRSLAEARGRGFRLAFNQTVLSPPYQRWLPLVGFIKVDLLAHRVDQLHQVVELAQKKVPAAKLIVEQIETVEQRQQIGKQGGRLFQGYWFAKPVMVTDQVIRPAHAVVIQLINAVRNQATPEQIEEVLRRDTTISFNLLRYINSSSFGLRTEITSFRHAVMILGLQKLFRWAALLLTTSSEGGSPPALGNLAIVRGRMMELLATDTLPPDECDNAFVTGVFSLLDTMLGIPMEQALGAITLPESVTDALLHQRGPLAPFLKLVVACESADDRNVAGVAAELTLDNRQVNQAHLQALAWAETMGQ